MKGRVLFVDDDAAMCDVVKSALPALGFEVTACTSAAEALELLSRESFDVVLTDLNMKEMGGIELGKRALEQHPYLPIIVVTAFGSMESAIEAMRAGAYDFVTKPFQLEDLGFTVQRAVQHRRLGEEVRRLRDAVADDDRIDDIIGESTAIREMCSLLSRVADADATVLVTGESGTGKELVAKAVHKRSRRRAGPFVAINCAAVTEAILESELFGHVRGAFTDAKASKAGLFVQASGGTLFLDEIGEMPAGMQVKLLRALQERTVRPVGGEQEVPFDARIVAATNRDLETEVAERRFREDLFYRINVVRLQVPPLRARSGDVLMIAQNMVERFANQCGKGVVGISSQAAEKLVSYDWPGNVRELQNCIERAVALTRYDQLTVEDLPEKLREHRPSHMVVPTADPSELLTMDEVERRYIFKVLQSVGGNKTLAAQVLGFDRRTLYRKLERFEGTDRASHE